jgi:hypothetical protein
MGDSCKENAVFAQKIGQKKGGNNLHWISFLLLATDSADILNTALSTQLMKDKDAQVAENPNPFIKAPLQG